MTYRGSSSRLLTTKPNILSQFGSQLQIQNFKMLINLGFILFRDGHRRKLIAFLKLYEANGLIPFGEKDAIHIKFIRPNQKYAFYITVIKKGVVWSKVEDQAIEEKTLLVVQNALSKLYKAPVKVFPKRIMFDQEGKPLMEWDGILTFGDKVFLCESKHKMTHVSINELINNYLTN